MEMINSLCLYYIMSAIKGNSPGLDNINAEELTKMMEILREIRRDVANNTASINAMGGLQQLTYENTIKSSDITPEDINIGVKHVVKETLEKGKKYELICGTEDIYKILKCILDAIIFVYKIMKELLNLRKHIIDTVKNVPLVSSFVFIINILFLFCYIYVICLVIHFIGCRIGNPELAEDAFRIFVRYMRKLFEFACNPNVIENTKYALSKSIRILDEEISDVDLYKNGKETIMNSTKYFRNVVNNFIDNVNNMNDGMKTIQNTASTITEVASNVATGAINGANAITEAALGSLEQLLQEPKVQTLNLGNFTILVKDGGKKNQKKGKRKKTNKRKSKYKKGRISKKKYIKGGSHNELVKNLYGIVNGMNTGNSNLENLSPEDLKRFQLLSKIHTDVLSPVFDLIFLCLDSSKLIN